MLLGQGDANQNSSWFQVVEMLSFTVPRCLIIVKHLMVSGDGFRLAISGFDRKRVEPLLIGRQTATPFCSAFTCHHSIKCQHISHKFWVFLPAQQKSKYTTQLVYHMFLKIQYFPTFQQIPTKKAKENRKPRSNHHQKLAQPGKNNADPWHRVVRACRAGGAMALPS